MISERLVIRLVSPVSLDSVAEVDALASLCGGQNLSLVGLVILVLTSLFDTPLFTTSLHASSTSRRFVQTSNYPAVKRSLLKTC